MPRLVTLDFSPPDPHAKLRAELESLSDDDLTLLAWKMKWKARARSKQLAPPEWMSGDKAIWGIRSGRGFGKTLTAAETCGQLAVENPGMIINVIAPTYDDARYVCFEGPTGLMSVIPDRFIADQNKALPSLTLTNGTYFRGFAADTPDRLRGPQCFPSDTLITMADGSQKPISRVESGEFVSTRGGSREVLRSWKSGSNRELWSLKTVHGRTLSGTMEHPIWADGQFVPLWQLKPGQRLWCSGVKSIDGNLAVTMNGSNELAPGTKENESDVTFTEMSTRPIAVRFLRTTSFLTETTTKVITLLKTWKPSLVSFIIHTIKRVRGRAQRLNDSVLRPIAKRGFNGKRLDANAGDAGKSITQKHHDLDSFAVGSVEIDGEVDRVLSVEKSQNCADVYDLTIAEEHEFFADRILVHNCHLAWCEEIASWKYPKEAWSNIEFGLRLGKIPRLVWTGTPRPTTFMKERSIDPHAIVVLGSTYENRENLTQLFYDNVAKYEGTKIGRQELYGELIDPEESGLVQRSQWRLWPAKTPLPKFRYIVYSLDTAFTEKTYDKKKTSSDPTANSVWGLFEHKGLLQVMLLDCWEEWLGLPALIQRVKREKDISYGDADEPLIRPIIKGPNAPSHQGRKPDLVVIEDKGSGISLRQSLAMENIITHPYNPGQADKLSRLHMVTPLFAAGRVWAVESDVRPGEPKTWADPLITQVCTYVGEGSVERDDLLDTSTQALKLMVDQFFPAFTVKPDLEKIERMKAVNENRRRLRRNPYGDR